MARPGPAYLQASSALTPEQFTQLYQTDGRTLEDIAATIGVSRPTLAQLARDYG